VRSGRGARLARGHAERRQLGLQRHDPLQEAALLAPARAVRTPERRRRRLERAIGDAELGGGDGRLGGGAQPRAAQRLRARDREQVLLLRMRRRLERRVALGERAAERRARAVELGRVRVGARAAAGVADGLVAAGRESLPPLVEQRLRERGAEARASGRGMDSGSGELDAGSGERARRRRAEPERARVAGWRAGRRSGRNALSPSYAGARLARTGGRT
jgi:hypothetical protein